MDNSNGLNYFFKGLLLGIITVIITSCDPGQTILIQNLTAQEATIKIYFKEKKPPYIAEVFEVSDSLIINFDGSNEHSTKEYHFGIGHWEVQDQLDNLVSSIEKIEVITWKSREIYRKEPQIRAFFKSKITGNYKEVIDIKLE